VYYKMTTILVVFGSLLRGPKFCLEQSCSTMDLNKAVPSWRRTSWRKRYGNTMRTENQAKLAAGAYRGHMAKYFCVNKCLQSSVTAMPAAACAQLPFGGGMLLSLRAAAIWGGNVAHTDQFFQKRLFFRGGPLRVVRLGITQKEDHPGQREGIHSIKMAVFVCLIFRFFRHVPQKNRNFFCRRH